MDVDQATILVVDDLPENLGILSEALNRAGHKVLLNESGELAIETALKTIPDLIILDVMMPGIDGFETCRRLKDNPVTEDIPIIFMTALGDSVDEIKGLKLGAVDYITKPIKMKIVMARVNTHLTLKKTQEELRVKNQKLQEALDAIKTLSGIIPICAWCGQRIKNEEGQWMSLVPYLQNHTEAKFTHGMCPECNKDVMGELEP